MGRLHLSHFGMYVLVAVQLSPHSKAHGKAPQAVASVSSKTSTASKVVAASRTPMLPGTQPAAAGTAHAGFK